MLYALFLLTILLLLLSSLISYSLIRKTDTINALQKSILERNVNSAISLLLDPEVFPEKDISHKISLFGNTDDSVLIKRSHWGAFEVIEASYQWRNFYCSQIALCGDYKHTAISPALTIFDSYKPLCISGTTFLKGIIDVPKEGIKSVPVDGKYYTRKELVFGKITIGEFKLPRIKPQLESLNPVSILAQYTGIARIAEYILPVFSDTLINSFTNEAVILYSRDILTLDHCLIKGKVIIISNTEVNILKTSMISDAIVCGKVITIESGFKGTGQFIASDSLLCSQSCTFPFPSVLAVINQSKSPAPFLQLGKKSSVMGTILCYSKDKLKSFTPMVLLEKESILTGSLYSNQQVCLLGSVYGNISTTGFYYRSPSGIYDNYLVDGTIDYSRQRSYYIGINYEENKSLRGVMKWLY